MKNTLRLGLPLALALGALNIAEARSFVAAGRHVSFEIDGTGRLVSMREKASGRELVSAPAPFVVVKRQDGRFLNPTGMSHSGDALTFSFEGGDASIRITPFCGGVGWTIESTGCTVPDASAFEFARVVFSEAEVRGIISNAVVDDRSGVAVRGYTPEVEMGDLETWSGVWHNDTCDRHVAAAFVERRFGFAGWRAGLVAGPYKELLGMLRQMAEHANVVRTECGGPWSLGAKANKMSYLFATRMVADSRDDWFRLMEKTGARCIHLFRWWRTIGHYAPSPVCFPRGYDDIAELCAAARAAGYAVGTHTLSAACEFGDPFVDPRWFDDYETDAEYTLARPFRRGDDVLWINEKPASCHAKTLTGGSNGNILRLGDDLLQYADFTTEPPYRFTGVQPSYAAYGEEEVFDDTQAGGGAVTADEVKKVRGGSRVLSRAEYPAGAALSYLHHRYGEFSPKPGSKLAEALTDCLADFFNRYELNEIYFDGAEVCRGRYSIDKLRELTFAKLRHSPGGTVNGTSSRNPFNWWHRSIIGTWDHARYGAKRFLDRHIANYVERQRADFLETDFGWWKPLSADPTARGYFPDVAQYFGCKCAAYDSMVSIQGVSPTDGPLPYLSDVQVTISGWWDRGRYARAFRPELIVRMRRPGDEFRLGQARDGSWQVEPCRMATHGAVAPYAAEWRVETPPAARTAVRVESLYAKDESKPLRRLFDASMLPSAVRESAEGVTLEAVRSSDPERGETIRLTARNATAPANASWARLARNVPANADLRAADGSTLWVRGDGSGALLNVQVLTRSSRSYSESVVMLDFKGWRKVDLFYRERDVATTDGYVWPYMDQKTLKTPAHPFRFPTAGRPITALSFYLNGIPAGGKAEVELGAWDTFVQKKDVLPAGTSVVVDGRPFAVPFDLPGGDYAELENGFWTHFAENGTPVGRVSARAMPELSPGVHALALAMPAGAAFSRAEVSVFSYGAAEPAFAELSDSQRALMACEFELPFVYAPEKGLGGDFTVRVRPGEKATLGFEIVGPAKDPVLCGNTLPVELRDEQDHLYCDDGRHWKAVRIVPGISNQVTENRVTAPVRTTLAEGELGSPIVLGGGETVVPFSSRLPGARVTLFKRYAAGHRQ